MKKLLLIGLLISTSAFADDVTLQGGLQQTPNSNYGNGSEWVARYEHRLGDFGLGLEGAYHGKTAHNSDTGTYGDVSGYSVMAGPFYHPPVSWKLKPYIGGLLGWSWWYFDRSQDMADRGIEINLGDSLAYKAAVGFDYPLGNSWFLNVEYFYFGSWVPKESHYTATGEFANVVTSDDRLGQGENCVMVGVGYRW